LSRAVLLFADCFSFFFPAISPDRPERDDREDTRVGGSRTPLTHLQCLHRKRRALHVSPKIALPSLDGFSYRATLHESISYAIFVLFMRSRDTSERAAAVQAQLQNSLSPEDRFSLALKYSDFARQFARAALRQRHPDLTETEITRALIRQLHGNVVTFVK